MQDLPPLSKREAQVMDILYARGAATATDVMADMPDRPSRAAVRTFLRILEDKGHIAHRREGRHFVFKPTRARRQVGQSSLRRVLNVFFGGSLEQALAAYLAEQNGAFKPEELAKMAALIRKARKENR
jgi:BlaI family transcriptional regulator, penicillinase repressor